MKGGNFISKLIKVLAVIIHETDLKFTRFTVFIIQAHKGYTFKTCCNCLMPS